ncbi:MAG: hypothetical protein AB7O73_15735, partial [Bacteroidia bacterium]
HVSDIVSGLYEMSKDDWNGDVFNLGTGTNYSIKEVADMFERQIVYIPERRGEAKETKADISFTQSKLNWFPRFNLRDYVRGFCEKEKTNILHNSK